MLDRADEGNLRSSFLNAVARNGWGHMLNNKATDDKEIRFSWKLDLNGEPVEYVFACTVGNNILFWKSLTLLLKMKNIHRCLIIFDVMIEHLERVYSQAPLKRENVIQD